MNSATGDLGHREISAMSELGYEENSPKSEVGQKENSAKSCCHPNLKSEELYGPFLMTTLYKYVR